MKKLPQLGWVLLLALGALGGLPRSNPLDLVRQGNAAYARGDFTAAVDLYSLAEECITDPGLVAFNKATTLYRLGRYREAEMHYQRCREDAEGPRLAHLLYGLGNAIVQQAGSSDAARLTEAIHVYEECLRQDGAEPDLIADARHNLELALLLRIKALGGKDKSDPNNPDPGEDGPPPQSRNHDGDRTGSQGGRANVYLKGKTGIASESRGPGDAVQTETPFAPGKGNLPPLPDADDLTTMSAEDAAEYLKQATARIAEERKAHQQRAAPAPPSNLMDW